MLSSCLSHPTTRSIVLSLESPFNIDNLAITSNDALAPVNAPKSQNAPYVSASALISLSVLLQPQERESLKDRRVNIWSKPFQSLLTSLRNTKVLTITWSYLT